MDSSPPNEWRKLLEDNKNFSQDVPFDIEKIIQRMEIAIKDLDNLNPFYVLSPIYDFTKFFYQISSALGRGFSDITSKVEIIRGLLMQNYKTENSIQSLINKEISLGIHELNGSNNSSHGHGDDEYKKYTSAARTFLRLSWFMEFLIRIFRKFLNAPQKTMREVMKESYQEVLAPRHSWFVRSAVTTILTFASVDKMEALKIIFGYDEFNEEAQAKVKYVADTLEKIWKTSNDFYTEKNLLNLE